MQSVDVVFIEPSYSIQGSRKVPKDHLPNLGLCILAGILEREGYKVAIVDGYVKGYSCLQVVKEVLEMRPKYACLTTMTHNISFAAEIGKLLKQKEKGIKVIAGGIHITAVPEDTLRKYGDCFDICVIGEGDLTVVDLLETLETQGDLSKVDGLAFMQEGRFFRTKPRERIKDLNTLPLPAWHLLPDMKKHYSSTFVSAGNTVSNHLITSRGCTWGKCIFCDTGVHGRICRFYSADYVMEMIEVLHKKYGVNDIQFTDDSFVTNKKRLFEICDRLIEKNFKLTWACMARAGEVTEEKLSKMKAAGCWQIAYGIETGSERIMKFLKKGVTLKQVTNAVELTNKVGIKIKGFFILGHPTETHESIKKTTDLMLSLDIDVIGLTFFTVYPGSPMADKISEYGEFDTQWDFAFAYKPSNFTPKGFTAEELSIIREQALKSFYLRPKYIFNQIRKIKRPYDVYRLISGGRRAVSKYILGMNWQAVTQSNIEEKS